MSYFPFMNKIQWQVFFSDIYEKRRSFNFHPQSTCDSWPQSFDDWRHSKVNVREWNSLFPGVTSFAGFPPKFIQHDWSPRHFTLTSSQPFRGVRLVKLCFEKWELEKGRRLTRIFFSLSQFSQRKIFPHPFDIRKFWALRESIPHIFLFDMQARVGFYSQINEFPKQILSPFCH